MKKILMMLLMGMFLISFASAWEWDNTYRYDDTQDKAIIENAFGLGEDLGYAELIWGDTKVPAGVDIHVGTYGVYLYDAYDASVFDELIVEDLTGDNKKYNNKNYKVKVVDELGAEIEVPKYTTECTEVPSTNSTNGTVTECNEVFSHYETEYADTTYEWKDIKNPNFAFQANTYYEVGIFMDIEVGDKGDWKPDFLGIVVDEWATFQQSTAVGLVSYYRLDEQAGATGTIMDELMTNPATNDGADNTTGKINTGYNFDVANTDGINAGNDASLQLTTGTISAWIYYEDQATNGNIFNKNLAYALLVRDQAGSDTLAFYDWGGGAWRDTAQVIPTNTWVHVALNFNDTSADVYYNGTLLGNYAHSVSSQTNPFYIGKGSSGEYFEGDIDEVGIWGRQLTNTEMTEIFNSGTGLQNPREDYFWVDNGLDTGAVSYYKLDDNNFSDSVASNDGTNTNTINTSGIIVDARRFDGTTDYITLDNEANFDFANSDTFSISSWVNFTTTTGDLYVVSKLPDAFPYAGITLSTATGGKIKFVLGGAASGTKAVETSAINDGSWHHVIATYDGSETIAGLNIYVDGVLNRVVTSDTTMDNILNNVAVKIGSRDTGALSFNGDIDEVGIWNTTLNSTQIQALYNYSSALVYGSVGTPADAIPTITLNAPANDTEYKTQSVQFNCTATDDINLENVSLYINGVLNETNSSPVNNTIVTFDKTFAWNTDNNWSCNAYDNASQEGTTETRTFRIDNDYPTITLNAPVNNTNLTSNVVAFNCSATDDIELSSVSLYINGVINETNSSGLNNTNYIFTKTLDWETDYNYTCTSIDALAQSTTATTKIFRVELDESDVYNYSTPQVEGLTYFYTINISANQIDSSDAVIYWNGTGYNMTEVSSNTTDASYSYSKAAPFITANTEVETYITYTINDNEFNSTAYNITLYNIDALGIGVNGSCSAGLSQAMCWDWAAEETGTDVNLVNADYVFRYGITNSSQVTASGSATNINDLCLCVNSTIYNNYSVGYGEIQYDKSGYSDRRNYVFSNQRLSNTTINNTLYLLNSSSSNSFLFTIQDGSLQKYSEVYLTQNRWYPENDTYKVTEMAKTDDKGQSVMKVEVEDTDYRIGVYETNGSLIYLADPIRFVCISAPCSYTLTIPADAEDAYSNWNDLEIDFTFNTTTKVYTLVYNDPSQDTSEIRLEVYKQTGTGESLICSDTASSYTGVLSCNVSAYSGTLKAIAYRTASPEIVVSSLWGEIRNDTLTGDAGLFVTMIIMILMVTIGVVSPILSVLLSVIALVPALAFGIIPLGIGLVFCAMSFIVIHFMKRGAA